MGAANEHWNVIVEQVRDLCENNENEMLIIAIDGKSGSGKSTLAAMLKEQFGGNVFHMDDFFLQPTQRTKERLAQIGGNVDYERFREVLLRIRRGMGVYYQRYDCKRQGLEEPVWIEPACINIVEGSYSMHPYFGEVYDLRIGMDIDAQSQRKRILHRNGAPSATI